MLAHTIVSYQILTVLDDNHYHTVLYSLQSSCHSARQSYCK